MKSIWRKEFWKGLGEYALAAALFLIVYYILWFMLYCRTGFSALEMCRGF